jgi:hypothetical protein
MPASVLKNHQTSSYTRRLAEAVFLNVYGAPELIPRNEFRHLDFLKIPTLIPEKLYE